jgi:hypothetical protein
MYGGMLAATDVSLVGEMLEGGRVGGGYCQPPRVPAHHRFWLLEVVSAVASGDPIPGQRDGVRRLSDRVHFGTGPHRAPLGTGLTFIRHSSVGVHMIETRTLAPTSGKKTPITRHQAHAIKHTPSSTRHQAHAIKHNPHPTHAAAPTTPPRVSNPHSQPHRRLPCTALHRHLHPHVHPYLSYTSCTHPHLHPSLIPRPYPAGCSPRIEVRTSHTQYADDDTLLHHPSPPPNTAGCSPHTHVHTTTPLSCAHPPSPEPCAYAPSRTAHPQPIRIFSRAIHYLGILTPFNPPTSPPDISIYPFPYSFLCQIWSGTVGITRAYSPAAMPDNLMAEEIAREEYARGAEAAASNRLPHGGRR